ncbi:hypothetical protein [Pseudalkalibacillus sp. SCS-8]|uniref:hypothetical protein n=1 Tax=Pseudalkalibacillus nanhaiensis TaxID=3115291 RepID=UPI0032DAA041
MDKVSFKIIASVSFISGIILFGIMHHAIATISPNIGAWDAPGRFGFILSEITGWFPYILSVSLMCVGISMFWYEIWSQKTEDNK